MHELMVLGQLSKGRLSNENFVRGDFCPRRLLSKEDYCPRKTIVQGDNCPRRLLSKETIVQVLMSAHALYTGACKKKLSNFKPQYILPLPNRMVAHPL